MLNEENKRIFTLETKIAKLETQCYEAQQRIADIREGYDFLCNELKSLKNFLHTHYPQALSHYYYEQELKLSLSDEDKNSLSSQ